MKIARVVLTATILFSLKSTLFCSEKQTETAPALVRTNSGIHHDGTRDGLFGSGFDTLKNIQDKKSYCGQPYGMGSDSQAPQRWEKVGQQITKLEDAQTFMAEVERLKEFGLTFSEKALQASKTLIKDEDTRLEVIRIAAENQRIAAEQAAENQRIAAEQAIENQRIAHEATLQAQFEQADSQYLALNQQSKALLKALYVKKTETRKAEKKALAKKYADLLKVEEAQLKETQIQEDLELTAELVSILNQLDNIKTNQNNSNTSHKITRLPFVTTADKINKKNLGKLAYEYCNWTPKIKTYAQAVQDGKPKNTTYAQAAQDHK